MIFESRPKKRELRSHILPCPVCHDDSTFRLITVHHRGPKRCKSCGFKGFIKTLREGGKTKFYIQRSHKQTANVRVLELMTGAERMQATYQTHKVLP